MKPSTKRALVLLGICAVCTLLFAILWKREFPPLKELEFYTQDLQTRKGRKTAYDDRLVLIGIDKLVYDQADFSPEEIKAEPTLSLLQQNYPWSRAVWARLIQKLGDAGAKVIVFDLVFLAPGDGDKELHEALEKYGDRVVIGYNFNKTQTPEGRAFIELQLPNSDILTPRTTNSEVTDPRLGYVNIWSDDDGTLRRANYRLTGDQVGNVLSPETTLESLDARVVRAFGRPDLIPVGFDSHRFRYTGRPGTFRPARIGDVLSPKIWAANFHNGADFKGKIVFIGPTTELFHDEHDTPFLNPKAMPGPEIHLNIINAALHGEFLGESSAAAELFLIVLAGILAAAVGSVLRQPVNRFIGLILLTVAYAAFSQWTFVRAGTSARVLLTATPILVFFLSGIVALTYDYLLERLEKRRVRRTLERYVSRDVVKELLDNPQTYFNALGGVRRSVAILFSDVRNFTTMTESADSQALVKQLNEYFQEMVKLVFQHSGSLDKFIGDAVMAVWGNIKSESAPKDGCNAVATALAMHKALAKLNADWKARGIKELAIGIGINYGEAIVGQMGSSEKAEFTAIGDAVNVASRLEGLTKKYHVDLLIGESVAPLVRDRFILRTVASVQPKGKTVAADVFTVLGEVGNGPAPAWLGSYENGVRLYRQKKFAEAAAAFKDCLKSLPQDYLSTRYLGLCEELIKNPPPDSWTPAEVMTDK